MERADALVTIKEVAAEVLSVDPGQVTEAELRSLIAEMGFTVADQSR